ncbi:MAG TPA: LuxR C-terminal-related transcriptional regulator [Nitrospiraceae bacterium]|nr:LuxR C-terminal-related transcriptional regulator [Nitrospiraceae bacterium]
MLYKDDERLSALLARADRPDRAEGSAVAVSIPARRHRPEDLTPREREILDQVWSGCTNRSIAQQLGISIKTVEAHRANMMKKLRVSNTAQLLKTALESGLLAAGMESR